MQKSIIPLTIDFKKKIKKNKSFKKITNNFSIQEIKQEKNDFNLSKKEIGKANSISSKKEYLIIIENYFLKIKKITEYISSNIILTIEKEEIDNIFLNFLNDFEIIKKKYLPNQTFLNGIS